MAEKFVLVADTGYLGIQGQSLSNPEIMNGGRFVSDSGPPLCATCTCGVNDLKKPHSPSCRFGKPLRGS